MDDETIDLAARLGLAGVAELRALHDKAGRLALMIHDKLALPKSGDGYHNPFVTDAVGVVWLDDDLSAAVFAPRVIQVIHGVEAEINQHFSVPGFPLPMTLASRELERVLAPAPIDRIDDVTFALEFEGEVFVVDVWNDMDDVDIAADTYDRYDAEWVCFCDLVACPRQEGTNV